MEEEIKKVENKAKNVVIIIVDAFRPKNTSLFGYNQTTDKNLKRITEDSLLFRNFFSGSNATAPSLTSIFTGQYPNNHGIIHQFPYTTQEEMEKLDHKKFWLPSYLRDKGYNTIAIDWIGLWLKEGFNYYEEKEEKQSKLKRFIKIPAVRQTLIKLPNWAYKLGKKMVKTRGSVSFSPAKDTMNLAISKIQESEKPFFLFLHFWDTHFPFPTTKFKGSGKKDIDEVLEKIESKSQKEYFKKRITDIDLYSIEDMIAKYDAAITGVDKQIGKLHSYLKNNGLWDETVFIVLGDHGTNLADRGIYFSSSGLYDDTIHVPFIMHLPGFEKKEITKGFVQNVDIAPTILDFINEKVDADFDGKSMLNLIKKDEPIRDKAFFFDGLSGNIKGVRTASKKLIIAKDKTCNLCKSHHHEEIEEYDLEQDPKELKNIYSGNSELMGFLEEGFKEKKNL